MLGELWLDKAAEEEPKLSLRATGWLYLMTPELDADELADADDEDPKLFEGSGWFWNCPNDPPTGPVIGWLYLNTSDPTDEVAVEAAVEEPEG